MAGYLQAFTGLAEDKKGRSRDRRESDDGGFTALYTELLPSGNRCRKPSE